MKKENLEKIQSKLDWTTRKIWFFILFILISLTPPITKEGYSIKETGIVIFHILRSAFIKDLSPVYPVFKIIPTILIIALILFKNRVRRIFNLYAGVSYFLFSIVQGVGITHKYGFGIVTGNVIGMLIVSMCWFWETLIDKGDLTPSKISPLKYWVAPLAFLAFWYPVNPETLKPDFNPVYLFVNSTGLAFCTMTPIYIGILSIYYPKVNLITLRITSLMGVIIGFWNILTNFVINPHLLWWNGILHLPLVFISIYGLVLSLKKIKVTSF